MQGTSTRTAHTLLALVRATTLATFAIADPPLPSHVLGVAVLYVAGACVLGTVKARWRPLDSILLTAVLCSDLAWCTAALVYSGALSLLPVVLYAALVAALVAAHSGPTAIAVGVCAAGVYYGTVRFLQANAGLGPVPGQLAIFQATFVALVGVLSGCLADQWRQLRRARAMVERLLRLGRATARTPLDEGDLAVYADAVEDATKILKADRAWVMAPVRPGPGLVLAAVGGVDPPGRRRVRSPEPIGLAHHAFSTGVPVVAGPRELARMELTALEGELCVGSSAAAAIQAGGKRSGVLVVSRNARAEPFTDEDVAVLKLLCASVAACLKTAHLIRELHESSITDSLTGLYNHGVFLTKLAEHVQHARKAGQELSLLVLDMDGFKQINDTAGHWEGNHVLRALADALRRECRESDVIARCGGDEFAVLLPGVGPEGAAIIAERAARALQKAAERPGVAVPISASWGIASYPWDASNDEALFRRADSRLYQAKKAGGNRLAFDSIVLGTEDTGSCVKPVGEPSIRWATEPSRR